jgi:hypothetical protein
MHIKQYKYIVIVDKTNTYIEVATSTVLNFGYNKHSVSIA